MDSINQFSSFNSSAPLGFGYHPKVRRAMERYHRDVRNPKKQKSLHRRMRKIIEDKGIPIQKFANSCHPEVFIIPRDMQCHLVEAPGGEVVAFHRTELPFSSTDFFVDIDEADLFHVFASGPLFRLVMISQLGYLVPPRPDEWDKKQSIAYTVPQFRHSRWEHSLLVAILMEVILARNGFSQRERATKVLAAACHDIAMPAGGDSVKRVDPEALDEEKNFIWVLNHYDLAKKWNEEYGFDVVLAQEMVENKGVFGRLLDVFDKISYTALDCYHVGLVRPGKIRSLCLKHPLIMDIWQDIKFTTGRTKFFFSKPGRLFYFLLLRAYEHQEFLFNPYSRALDLFLKNLVQPLYDKGIITREQLLIQNDEWLEAVLTKHYPEALKPIIEPEELSCQKFETEKEQQAFVEQLGNRLSHTEYIGGIDTGLDWPVRHWGRIIPLREAISQDEVDLLEGVAKSTIGYYVYYYKAVKEGLNSSSLLKS